MKLSRREWLAGAGSTAIGLAMSPRIRAAAAEAGKGGIRVGMCDWSMGRFDPTAFELAKQAGLDGVEVSVGFPKDNLKLRRPEMQKQLSGAAFFSGLGIGR